MKALLTSILLGLFTSLCLGGLFGYEALESEDALVFYQPPFEEQAEEVLRILHSIREGPIGDIGNDPGKITVLLVDLGTNTNGFADPVSKQITILVWPESDVWLNFESWYRSVLIHEFTHIVHLREEGCLPLIFTDFTGFPLLNPQFRTPFVEATTVYEESKGGSGRLNNPFLTVAMLGSMSRSWRYSLEELAVPPSGRFLSGLAHYMVPASFYEHLVENYGSSRVREFLREHSCNVLGLGLGFTFESVFGRPIQIEYEDWLRSLRYDLPEGARKLFFPDRSVILDVDVEGDWIYLTALRYDDRSSMGGTRGFVGRFNIEEGIFEKIFDFRYVPKKIEIDGENLFYLEDVVAGEKIYPILTRRIVYLEPESGRTSVIAQGRITTFDVRGGRVYWAEYDPSLDVSTVFEDGIETVKIRGLLREMAVSEDGDMAVLISRDGNSSILELWRGEEMIWRLEDRRYKYSLSWSNGILTFVMFDEETADLYSFDGVNMKRLTENSIFERAFLKGSKVYGITFDPDSPSLGLIETEISERSEKVRGIEPEFELKSVKIRRRDADTLFVLDLIHPDFRIPYILWDGKWVSLGVMLADTSYDYSISYLTVPMVLYGEGELRLGFGGLLLVKRNGVEILFNVSSMNGFAGIENSMGLSARGTLWRERFSPWTSGEVVWKFRADLSGNLDAGLLTRFYVGDDFVSVETGVDFVEGRFNSNYYSLEIGHVYDELKLTIGGEVHLGTDRFSLKFETISPLLKPDWGILDPYFHVSELHVGLGLGYSSKPRAWAFLGLEFAQFLTYTRNFVRLGIECDPDGLKPYIGFGGM